MVTHPIFARGRSWTPPQMEIKHLPSRPSIMEALEKEDRERERQRKVEERNNEIERLYNLTKSTNEITATEAILEMKRKFPAEYSLLFEKGVPIEAVTAPAAPITITTAPHVPIAVQRRKSTAAKFVEFIEARKRAMIERAKEREALARTAEERAKLRAETKRLEEAKFTKEELAKIRAESRKLSEEAKKLKLERKGLSKEMVDKVIEEIESKDREREEKLARKWLWKTRAQISAKPSSVKGKGDMESYGYQ